MIFALGEKKPTFKGDYFVAETAAVIGNVVFGEHVNVWWGATIRADNDVITLGDNVNVQDGAVLHVDQGIPLTLHKNVSIGHQVMLHGCTVHENALIGIGAIVLNGAVIGRNSLIGAGALVPEGKVIPDGSLVLGAPGKVMRLLTPDEITHNTRIAEHYVERAEFYRTQLARIA